MVNGRRGGTKVRRVQGRAIRDGNHSHKVKTCSSKGRSGTRVRHKLGTAASII